MLPFLTYVFIVVVIGAFLCARMDNDFDNWKREQQARAWKRDGGLS